MGVTKIEIKNANDYITFYVFTLIFITPNLNVVKYRKSYDAIVRLCFIVSYQWKNHPNTC